MSRRLPVAESGSAAHTDARRLPGRLEPAEFAQRESVSEGGLAGLPSRVEGVLRRRSMHRDGARPCVAASASRSYRYIDALPLQLPVTRASLAMATRARWVDRTLRGRGDQHEMQEDADLAEELLALSAIYGEPDSEADARGRRFSVWLPRKAAEESVAVTLHYPLDYPQAPPAVELEGATALARNASEAIVAAMGAAFIAGEVRVHGRPLCITHLI